MTAAVPSKTAPLIAKTSVNWLDQYAAVIVFVLVVTSFFVNLHSSDFERRKRITTVDESVYSRLGLQLKSGEAYNTILMYKENLKMGRQLPDYFKDPLFQHPPMFSFLISIAYAGLEKKSSYSTEELYALSSKVPNLMGCLLIVVVFLVGRRLYDVRVGLLAALVLAVEVNFLNCAHKVWMETTLATFFWLALYFFHKGCEKKWFLLLAGAALGCAMLTKYPAVLVVLIWLSYAAAHERRLFRSAYLYGGFFIAGVIFLPWLLELVDIYGEKLITGRSISAWDIRPLYVFIFVVGFSAMAAFILALLRWRSPQTFARLWQHTAQLNRAVAVLMLIFMAYLLWHADFRESLLVSLTWFGFPVTGWDISSISDEPKYYYIKQILKYSPVYIFFLIGLIRAPLGTKNDHYLLIAAFWTLLFTSFYGSYQGRYILYFTPAAILMASRIIVEIFDRILEEKSLLRVGAASLFGVCLVYFLAKTLQVGIYHAITINVAYY